MNIVEAFMKEAIAFLVLYFEVAIEIIKNIMDKYRYKLMISS